MANRKISELTSIGGTPSSGDIIPITDISDTTGSPDGTTKKVTISELVSAVTVDGTAITSTGETGGTKYLREDGDGSCSFQPVAIPTLSTESFRGTDNPHIGAHPNQSFLVVHNPSKSVMLASDPDGKIYVIRNTGKAEIATGISTVEDSSEPDIEITIASGTYSLITGDSDSTGINGLPVRQGFNRPDIGANPAPQLISGGSIT